MNFKTVVEMIENISKMYPQNIAVGDVEKDLTYSELVMESKKIASAISKQGYRNKPIAILMNRSVNIPLAMLGVMFSGNFYVVLDVESPMQRLNKIVETLSPEIMIYAEDCSELANKFDSNMRKMSFECMSNHEVCEDKLESIRKSMKSTDPIYSIFTSGSTGFPKGALLTNQNVISYINWYVDCFDITEKTVFGSQTPFYFSMSVSDFFSALLTGASYYMIPKSYFTFPAKLIDFMNEHKVNTIYWVPSALNIVAKLDLFKYCKPKYLEKVLFAGEVMPVKCLNYWRNHFPDLLYANLFGPTETTDICSYYIVNRAFENHETLPIGRSCDNCNLIVVDKNHKIIEDDTPGELFVSGPFVASGYYNNPDKTKEVFIQNPTQSNYPEIVYKTGDIVKRNKYGEIEYIGRKDFQIKHMGYRIELGEIEAVMSSVEGVEQAVCSYDNVNDNIILFYEGNKKNQDNILEKSRKKLPAYMQPQKCKHIVAFPKNANGKIDRLKLRELIKQ